VDGEISDVESVYSIEDEKMSVDSNKQYRSIKNKKSKHVDILRVNFNILKEE